MATREKFKRRDLEEELKAPDPFFEAIAEARAYFEDNRTLVVAAAGGVLAVAALLFGASSYYSSTRNAAATDFASAVANLEFDSPTAAEASLTSLGARSNTGPYQALGALYEANMAAESGRYEEAILGYDRYLESATTPYLKQVALMGKGYALERADKQADA
ncbi:MAG: tetratricopeptide repeat protein, partial [Deltaproteobacteria bacterium]|nr:tetratricopeptide repeat protein [Deltaproteobacteria bacterium]